MEGFPFGGDPEEMARHVMVSVLEAMWIVEIGRRLLSARATSADWRHFDVAEHRAIATAVADFEALTGRGVAGSVASREVLLGNATLMQERGVDITALVEIQPHDDR